ncbi:MAG TPA: tRNA adenosine(34) deaminase TadA [Phycisphaerae bacterium]|nr:tRNA adenosine(34) deaminase TadA [Phycisphaerae bacterium]HUU22375.1 tRNA adenosine(34) deaminase TadA [Phycisphaerae bacterium]
MSMDPEFLIRAAMEQATLAEAEGDVPIGAVIAREGVVIAAAGNRRIVDADPTAHAEMLAIRAATKAVGDWRLTGCTLAVTLEPCCMCAGAIVLARIDRLIYGAADPKAGAVRTLYSICSDGRLNHQVEVVSGVLADECGALLMEFFRRQRELGKK